MFSTSYYYKKKNGSLGLNMPFGDVSEKEKKYFVVRNENHRKC